MLGFIVLCKHWLLSICVLRWFFDMRWGCVVNCFLKNSSWGDQWGHWKQERGGRKSGECMRHAPYWPCEEFCRVGIFWCVLTWTHPDLTPAQVRGSHGAQKYYKGPEELWEWQWLFPLWYLPPCVLIKTTQQGSKQIRTGSRLQTI